MGFIANKQNKLRAKQKNKKGANGKMKHSKYKKRITTKLLFFHLFCRYAATYFILFFQFTFRSEQKKNKMETFLLSANLNIEYSPFAHKHSFQRCDKEYLVVFFLFFFQEKYDI